MRPMWRVKATTEKEAEEKNRELKARLRAAELKASEDAETIKTLQNQLFELKEASNSESNFGLKDRIAQLEDEKADIVKDANEAWEEGVAGLQSTFDNALAQVVVFQPEFGPDLNVLKPEYSVVDGKIGINDLQIGEVTTIIYPLE